VKAERIGGGERVDSVSLSDGRTIPADVVILGIGAKPRSGLAASAGLKTGECGAISVDRRMRTSDPDIFAAGDCAGKKDFFSKKATCIMLASTATFEARTAGANLFGPKAGLEDAGTIPIYSTRIGDLTLASAGMTESAASKARIGFVTGTAESPDRHPAKMPGAGHIKIKLVFSKRSGKLIGGQAAGGASAGEVVNLIGLGIQRGVTMKGLVSLQVATHPKLTPAPTTYPVIIAAQDAMLRGR
jgi:pyruvate/2-oxoglutarate dehydrogenase complex dihydrolipoamide dehydrogenase (E3) component